MATRFVLDASVVVAWLLDEEEAAPALAILDLFREQEAIVPGNWSFEVCNAVRKALRTNRITVETQTRLQQAVLALPVQFDSPSIERDWTAVLPLARQLELSVYDAAYLELALREGIALATFDDQLRERATALGVACL